jgi:hypothetical protein
MAYTKAHRKAEKMDTLKVEMKVVWRVVSWAWKDYLWES